MRVLHLPDKGEVAYCGMYIGAGTRDELPHQHGYAHLAEHMLFKGTHTRSAAQIINRLEAVGGELNAYTTKEETVLYAVALKRDLKRAVELVADVALHTHLTPQNLQKECQVVMDEIDSYLDSPSESILDDFEDAVFSTYSIGRNILGTPQSLQEVTVEGLQAFYDRCYTPDNMLFFIMGDVSLTQVEQWAATFLQAHQGVRTFTREVPVEYAPTAHLVEKQTSQAHCLIGSRAPSVYHPDRFAFTLLNNILGGPSTNSRLNMSLREKHAWVYQVESQYTPYTDTGIWSIYLGTDFDDLHKAILGVHKELEALQNKPLSDAALRRAKRQLLAQQLIASENKEGWVLSAAKNYFLHQKVSTVAQIQERLNAITAQQLQEVARRYFAYENRSQLVFK
jgi:predicted Zn-dependent peptidase